MARRRRRTRHRRGAVATAMALAVFGVVVLPWLSSRDGHDITAASEGGEGGGPTAELPDVVELTCLPEGIDVPSASIRPQANGMHMRVVNKLARSTQVWVESETGWRSGRFTVEIGLSDVVVSAPPGHLVVGCDAGRQEPERDVELVDQDNIHRDTSLDCEEENQDPTKLPVPSSTSSLAEAARRALVDKLDTGDHIAPMNGYPDTLYTTPMADPAVRVMRGRDTIAIVYLAGSPHPNAPAVDEPSLTHPWIEVHRVEHCPEYGMGTNGEPLPAAS